MKSKLTLYFNHQRSSYLFVGLMVLALVIGEQVMAQTMPTPQSIPYSQDFSTFDGTQTTYPAGWMGWKMATGNPTSTGRLSAPQSDRLLYLGDASTASPAGSYDYNGKIGFFSNSSNDNALCLALNTTGKVNVALTFDAMTIRNPYDGSTNTRIAGLALQYRVGESGNFAALTYQLDGSDAEYLTNTTLQTDAVTTPQNPISGYSIVLPEVCENQPVVQIRWVQRLAVSGGVGTWPSFALDNISVSGVDDTSTGILDQKNNGNIAISGNKIHIVQNGSNNYRVINIAGQTIQSGRFTDQKLLHIYESGIYVILLDGFSKRVLIQ